MEVGINKSETINIKAQNLELLPQKAIYWKEESALMLSDLHLGKEKHFRKNGIAVPPKSNQKNWMRLHQLLRIKGLQKVFLLGDLFHSDFNNDCKIFAELMELFPGLEFHLVMGNHDILEKQVYADMGFVIHEQVLEIGPFIFSHEPLEEDSLKAYNISGHIHPAVRLRGKGRQSHKAACFYFGKKQALLPAFGNFTGTHLVEVKEGDEVFLIMNEQVIPAH